MLPRHTIFYLLVTFLIILLVEITKHYKNFFFQFGMFQIIQPKGRPITRIWLFCDTVTNTLHMRNHHNLSERNYTCTAFEYWLILLLRIYIESHQWATKLAKLKNSNCDGNFLPVRFGFHSLGLLT